MSYVLLRKGGGKAFAPSNVAGCGFRSGGAVVASPLFESPAVTPSIILYGEREREGERKRKEDENDLRFTILPFFILSSCDSATGHVSLFSGGLLCLFFIYYLCVGRKKGQFF